MLENLVKISVPTTFAFFLALALTPLATHFFYKYKLWKKVGRSASASAEFKKIHNEAEELKTPRVGGLIIWVPAILTVLFFLILSSLFPAGWTTKMNFFSRSQTFIPAFTLLICSLIGLSDDFIQIFGSGSFAKDDASWRKWKVILVSLISFLIALWFYFKLDLTSFHIPWNGDWFFGVWTIPFFMLVALGTFSGGVIDGIDGLAGGVFASIFGAYSFIAFANNQIDLAAFCGVMTGGILAFLWFNVPPARFYMGETGILGLTITLATIAFLTNSVFILPVVALPLVITSASVILQDISKRWTGKKMFRLAPLHHHFESMGWPSYKVTMRFWIISVMFSIIGVILVIVSR